MAVSSPGGVVAAQFALVTAQRASRPWPGDNPTLDEPGDAVQTVAHDVLHATGSVTRPTGTPVTAELQTTR